MSYFAQHIRYTLECDACGLVEKRDLDASQEQKGTAGWGEVRLRTAPYFCCPGCLEKTELILTHHGRALLAAQKAAEEACAHDYRQMGLLAQCTKCKRWR